MSSYSRAEHRLPGLSRWRLGLKLYSHPPPPRVSGPIGEPKPSLCSGLQLRDPGANSYGLLPQTPCCLLGLLRPSFQLFPTAPPWADCISASFQAFPPVLSTQRGTEELFPSLPLFSHPEIPSNPHPLWFYYSNDVLWSPYDSLVSLPFTCNILPFTCNCAGQ